ncbi:hypothetical protein BOTBODRAFT_103774 [Botryobasidium botryosum FD-172 SS1]|uniref:Nuclear speckle splicing regulatory protein 1 N-terminal domain-containing protein n=1 Tax=Botryobasidium botryosum (strain FD-172 SS1) TaxID=930990 RepID=A0A067MRS2_BOTB1|nr:hypothetical protein BOTBODRAFT_103774 [Botryobasidium botryosum FD-172 SS1]
MSAPKLSFSLAAKPKPNPVGAAPSLKRPALFDDTNDPLESNPDAAPTASASSSSSVTRTPVNKQLIAQGSKKLSRAERKRMEEEKAIDNTVYEYDAVWDRMKDAERHAKEAREEESKERKPKYIKNLLNSAATRKLDHLRAEEKMMQREREAEGDEFADKEKFVTQAYKDQMAEVRRAEEEEKRREEEEKKKNKGLSTGMTHFYRTLLERSDEQRSAAVAATSTSSAIGPTLPPSTTDTPAKPNLTILKPPGPRETSDAELARLARETGKEVELNDDNQIVDRRQLLNAGLNLSAPNTRRLGMTSSKSAKNMEDVQVHRAAGVAASKKEIRERQARLIERQLEEENERAIREKERAEEEEKARVLEKRNNEAEIQRARQRYLERKKRKLEEAAAEGQVQDPETAS